MGYGSAIPPQQDTGQMGAFIAPSGQMQYITHHTDICTNRMQAHWVFFSAVVNERYYLEEICAFPVIMPTKYQTDVYEIIERVRAGGQICNILSSVFRLVGILIEIGTIHDPSNPFVYGARRYIEQHYPEHISDSGLADTLAVSLSTLYRKFQAYFHTTPANYINRFRLNKAACCCWRIPTGRCTWSVSWSDFLILSIFPNNSNDYFKYRPPSIVSIIQMNQPSNPYYDP